MINIRLVRLPPWEWPKVKKPKPNSSRKKTTLIWRNLVIMSIGLELELESREMFISSREICKENTTNEIPGLKYLMKLFQNIKIRKGVKWFPKCSNSFVPSPISEQGGSNFWKMGKGATNFGSHFLILSYHCNWHCFCILV